MLTYQREKNFTPEELKNLFLAVGWESGNYPEKLLKAVANYGCVWSARDEGKLVGLIAAMDDGIMTAYIHYLLVEPAQQGKGIGRELTRLLLGDYRDYLRILLVADRADLVAFYGEFGFRTKEDKKAMFLDRF